MDDNQGRPDPLELTLEQMQAVMAELLIRNYRLTVQVMAHGAVIEPVARRQVDYDGAVREIADNLRDHLLQHLTSLGLQEAFVSHLLSEARAAIEREIVRGAPN